MIVITHYAPNGTTVLSQETTRDSWALTEGVFSAYGMGMGAVRLTLDIADGTSYVYTSTGPEDERDHVVVTIDAVTSQVSVSGPYTEDQANEIVNANDDPDVQMLAQPLD